MKKTLNLSCWLYGIVAGIFIGSGSGLVYADTDIDKKVFLAEQIQTLTEKISVRPDPGASDQVWDNWRMEEFELRKERFSLIDRMEAVGLSDTELKSFVVMKLDDIESCFYHQRSLPNEYEGVLYEMMEDGHPLVETLATELFWRLNIHHVNTHLMHLSRQDIQTIADFELSRKDQPEAGRLMMQAIKQANLDPEDKVKWSTWILETMPTESEGYQLALAQNKVKSDIGNVIAYRGADMDGQMVDFADFRGHVVLVEYWAFWCGICLQEIPEIKAVYRDYYDQGLRVIGVFNDYRIDRLKQYVKDNEMPWPQLVPADATASSLTSFWHPLSKRYGLSGLPCYMLIDRDGRMVRIGSGRIKYLEPEIKKLLETAGEDRLPSVSGSL